MKSNGGNKFFLVAITLVTKQKLSNSMFNPNPSPSNIKCDLEIIFPTIECQVTCCIKDMAANGNDSIIAAMKMQHAFFSF